MTITHSIPPRRSFADVHPLTVIQSYLVTPSEQTPLTTLLMTGIERCLASLPGFVLGKVHRSLDGCRVVSYTQWRSRGAYESALHTKDVQEFLRNAAIQGRSIPARLYEVCGLIPPATPISSRPH